MASSPGTKFEWLVVVPDKPGTLAKRLEVRPTHFANLGSKVESGLLKMGGAWMFGPNPLSLWRSQKKKRYISYISLGEMTGGYISINIVTLNSQALSLLKFRKTTNPRA